jgi:hypothetical protein
MGALLLVLGTASACTPSSVIGPLQHEHDERDKMLLGVSIGSLAALGSALVAVGGIVQTGFSDRGCWMR